MAALLAPPTPAAHPRLPGAPAFLSSAAPPGPSPVPHGTVSGAGVRFSSATAQQTPRPRCERGGGQGGTLSRTAHGLTAAASPPLPGSPGSCPPACLPSALAASLSLSRPCFSWFSVLSPSFFCPSLFLLLKGQKHAIRSPCKLQACIYDHLIPFAINECHMGRKPFD